MDAPFTVSHPGGSVTVPLNQQCSLGVWTSLGSYLVQGDGSGSVVPTDLANGTVVADAVYIVKVEDLTDVVTWAPALPAGGSYQVYARWTADETRATDALYRIVHEGGTAEVTRNQRSAFGMTPTLRPASRPSRSPPPSTF